jgi:hypothetical protein
MMVYIFVIAAFVGGTLMIVGGVRKWPWLINPPPGLVFRHPLSGMRLFVPQSRLHWAAIVVGAAWIAMGAFVWYVSS